MQPQSCLVYLLSDYSDIPGHREGKLAMIMCDCQRYLSTVKFPFISFLLSRTASFSNPEYPQGLVSSCVSLAAVRPCSYCCSKSLCVANQQHAVHCQMTPGVPSE